MPELAQRTQIRQIQRPEVHENETGEILQPVHLDTKLGAYTTGGTVTTDEVIGGHADGVAVAVGQLGGHHVVDLPTRLQPPSLTDIDERVAVGAVHHHRLEDRLRAALPRLTGQAAIGGGDDGGALLVNRWLPPAGVNRSIETGGEDHVERMLCADTDR